MVPAQAGGPDTGSTMKKSTSYGSVAFSTNPSASPCGFFSMLSTVSSFGPRSCAPRTNLPRSSCRRSFGGLQLDADPIQLLIFDAVRQTPVKVVANTRTTITRRATNEATNLVRMLSRTLERSQAPIAT